MITLKSTTQHNLFISATCEDKCLELGSDTLVTSTELLSDLVNNFYSFLIKLFLPKLNLDKAPMK